MVKKKPPRLWPCHSCEAVYQSSSGLAAHKKQEHPAVLPGIKKNPDLRNCDLCGKVFASLRAIQWHKSNEHTEEECLQMDSEVFEKTLQEVDSKQQDKEANCVEKSQADKISVKFFDAEKRINQEQQRKNNSTDPGEHSETSPKKMFPCGTCGAVFRAARTRRNHRSKHHPNSKSYDWPCGICSAAFSSLRSRSRHRSMAHPKDSNLSCNQPQCGFICCSLRTLQKHKFEKHNQTLRYSPVAAKKCGLCEEESFYTYQELCLHLRVVHKHRDAVIKQAQFENYAAFRVWLTKLEERSPCGFTRRYSKSNPRSEGLACRRSGSYQPKQDRQRALRVVPTIKAGYCCTAFVALRSVANSEAVAVSYCSHHYKHVPDPPIQEETEDAQFEVVSVEIEQVEEEAAQNESMEAEASSEVLAAPDPPELGVVVKEEIIGEFEETAYATTVEADEPSARSATIQDGEPEPRSEDPQKEAMPIGFASNNFYVGDSVSAELPMTFLHTHPSASSEHLRWQCNICGIRFQTRKLLRDHRLQHRTHVVPSNLPIYAAVSPAEQYTGSFNNSGNVSTYFQQLLQVPGTQNPFHVPETLPNSYQDPVYPNINFPETVQGSCDDDETTSATIDGPYQGAIEAETIDDEAEQFEIDKVILRQQLVQIFADVAVIDGRSSLASIRKEVSNLAKLTSSIRCQQESGEQSSNNEDGAGGVEST